MNEENIANNKENITADENVAPIEENSSPKLDRVFSLTEFDECDDDQSVPAADEDEFDFVEENEYAPAAARKGVRRIINRENIKKYRYLALAFLVPALTMWLIYISRGTFPFGNGSVLVLDLNGQYVYYFEQLRNVILGDGSFLYTFGRALGGEFMGIYAYYLASPFSFLVCLFPKKMITEALLLMFLLKTGSCGLTFGIYLHYKTPEEKLNRIASVFFSTMYALSAYAVVQQHNTMWIDNLIMLPLIVMGVERLIKYRRFKLLVISLTIAVMSNFYIGYMMCIFVAVYFFICYFTISPEERNPVGEDTHFPKSFLRMAGCALLVISMSCVIIWSAYYSLTFGKTTFSNPSYDFLTSKFDLLDLISKLFIGSYDTVRPEGLPFIYCGTLTLLLVPIFFIIKKIPFREKVSAAFTVAFFSLCFSDYIIDIAWHGFQKPNWLNYRYSFMLTFFLVYIAYRAFLDIGEVSTKALFIDVISWVLILVIIQKLDIYEWEYADYGIIWLSFIFFAVYIVLLRFHLTSQLKNGLSLAIASVVVLECFVAGILNFASLDEDVVFSSRKSYRSYIDRVQPIVDMVKDGDDSFYRMEMTFHRKSNDPLALGYRGLTNSTSTLNASTIKFLRLLGLSSKSHWTKYFGGTPTLDTMLGLKYILVEEDDPVSELYEKVYTYDPGEENAVINAYLNPYALSIAYGVSPELLTLNLEDEDMPFIRMNQMMGLMAGLGGEAEIFVPIRLDNEDYKNLALTFTSGHRVYTNSSDMKGHVDYTFTAVKDGEVYCYFPSDYVRECDLYLNGTKFSTYYGNETCRIVELGYFKAGEEVEVSLHLTDNDKLYVGTQFTYFYYIDEDVFVNTASELAKSQFLIDSYTDDSFYGTINVSEGDELIYTSIPYDKGWVVTVDGKEADLVNTLDATISFYADPGTHTVTMEYRPACVIYGSIISLIGLAAFVAVSVVDFIICRRRAV